MIGSKKCFKCGETKKIREFYRHPQMKDGHLNKCKDCTRADSTKHRNENIEQVREYDRKRANGKERYAAATAITKRWRQEDKRRVAAHSAVRRAIISGRLTRLPCERCSRKDSHAHHDDYSKKLSVKWLCPVCHKQRHKELNDAGTSP